MPSVRHQGLQDRWLINDARSPHGDCIAAKRPSIGRPVGGRAASRELCITRQTTHEVIHSELKMSTEDS